MNLAVAGQRVERISFDFAVTLETGGDLVLKIESPFSVKAKEGRIARVDPEQVGDSAPAVLGLLHKVLLSIEIDEQDGLLSLEFADSVILTIEAGKEFEAWTLTTPELRVVSRPGGGTELWH